MSQASRGGSGVRPWAAVFPSVSPSSHTPYIFENWGCHLGGIEGIATWHVCGHHVGYGDMAEGLGPPATGFPWALRCWLCPLRAATSWCLGSGVCPAGHWPCY